MDIVGAFRRQLSRDLDWDARKERLLKKIENEYEVGGKFDRPLQKDDTPYMAHSLMDKGLADTRACAIGEALQGGLNNWALYKEVLSPILNCDIRNFRLLLDIEPRLIYNCLRSTEDRALIERLEGVLYD
jgi:hypothetical protein